MTRFSLPRDRRLPRLAHDRLELIASLVQGLDVLDIGCVNHNAESRDSSRWLHGRIRQHARTVLGLDCAATEIEKLRVAGFDVIAADATRFDLQRRFDVIVAGEVMEHVLNPGGLLQCARRHLRDDGRLVLTTPNANSLVYFGENALLGRELDNPDHSAFYTPVTLSALLAKCGFRVEHIAFLTDDPACEFRFRLPNLYFFARQWLQVPLLLLRPSLSQHFLTVARPAP